MTVDERAAAAPTVGASPYRGLRPYTELDEEYFFGREADIVHIADTAKANRFSVLYGPSGVGKSSVLRAGVVCHVRTENRMRYERFHTVESVVCYLNEWRDDPYATIREAVGRAFGETTGISRSTMHDSDDVVADVLELRASQRVDLILILDQFEEFFLYHEDEAESFAEELARLIERGNRVHALISIREDAMAKLDDFELEIDGVFDHIQRLDHLGRTAAEDAIRRPLQRYNAGRQLDAHVVIEDDLVAELLRQLQAGLVQLDTSQLDTVHDHAALADVDDGSELAASEQGQVRIDAPFLQLVLTRLWDEEVKAGSTRLRAATLEALGGAQKIVSDHLDRVMEGFDPADVAVLAAAFGYLVTKSGSKIAYAPSDLAEYTGHDPVVMTALLRRLSQGNQRILREVPPPMDQPHAESRFEIYHDVLARAVMEWRRRWKAQSDAAELLAAKEQAERETRITARRLRRTRLLLVGMSGLLVACLLLAFVAFRFKGNADRSAEDAKANEQQAKVSEASARTNEVIARSSLLRDSDPSRAMALALVRWRTNPDARLERVVRQTFDAASAAFEVSLGSPVLHADYVGGDRLVVVTKDGLVRVLGLAGDHVTPVTTVDTHVPVTDSALVDHGTKVVVGDQRGGVHVVDLARKIFTTVPDIEGGGPVSINAIPDSDGDLVALRTRKYVYVVNATTQQWTWPGPDGRIDDFAVDDTAHFMTAVQNRHVSVWDTRSKKNKQLAEVTMPDGGFGTVESARFVGKDSSAVLIQSVAGSKTSVWQWDWRRQAAPRPLQTEKRVNAVVRGDRGELLVVGDTHAFLYADGRESLEGADAIGVTAAAVNVGQPTLVALGAADGSVTVYSAGHQTDVARELFRFTGQTAPVTEVRFNPGADQLMSASLDGTIRLWTVPVARRVLQVSAGQRLVAARYAKRGRDSVAVTRDGTVAWVDDADADARLVRRQARSAHVQDIDVQPYGTLVAILERGQTRPEIFSLDGSGSPAFERTGDGLDLVRWSPDETQRRLVATTLANYLYAWDGATGRIITSVKIGTYRDRVTDLSFSADGSTLGTLSSDGTVRLIDTTRWEVLDSWQTNAPGAVAVSEDASLVATTAGSLTEIWERSDPSRPVCQLGPTSGRITDLAFSPDVASTRLAGAGADGVTYIWDSKRCAKGAEALLAQVRMNSGAIQSVAFDPRQPDTLLTSGADGVVSSYHCEICAMSPEQLLAAAEKRAMVSVKLDD